MCKIWGYDDRLECDAENSLHTTKELIEWVALVQERTQVKLERIGLDQCKPWFYDDCLGEIRNEKRTFFQITGIRYRDGVKKIEHPIIIQNEIGFLGILCTKINGVWHYLMQAKIEPGNVNTVQISPTIQATKSNFERKHGGNAPRFLDYFLNMNANDILVDQLQSEQSSRFLGKRNRNVILKVDRYIEETEYHRWMTLRQIKEFMKVDNLINMDTRTVLSCIPYVLLGEDGDVPFKNKQYFYKTAWNTNRDTFVQLYKYINDYKMFLYEKPERVKLHELVSWEMKEDIITNPEAAFEVIYCDISIDGREVQSWKQPLFSAKGSALFGLICCDNNGLLEFLVKAHAEVGCYDGIEIGPSIQIECNEQEHDDVEKLFVKKIKEKKCIIVDTMLSEEGGRFYQEQNRNTIIKIEKSEIDILPPGYVWSDFGTINMLTQINNCVNIQLRNLLSLLEI